MNEVRQSFDRRSSYFSEESIWSANAQLNSLTAKILLDSLSGCGRAIEVLDYGAGNGQVAAELSRRGMVVDVADISEAMLSLCTMARNRYNVIRDVIYQRYDAVVLRQVLQYVYEVEWPDFVSQLLGYLKQGGVLLFSQIVPYCSIDYGFWRDLVSERRRARRSYPTENEYFRLIAEIGATPLQFLRSTTRQSLRAWIEREKPALQIELRRILDNRSASVNAIWAFKYEYDGDLTWRNNWVHILVTSS
jgi:2-polyprenyl-3-methyl-5-hydroxy-6-metoxy-1,4-benzoquinol methylase